MATLTNWRPTAAISLPRSGMAARSPAVLAGLLVLGFCALVVLVQRYDAPVVLLAGGAMLAVLVLVLRPELATLLTVFLLYTNVPSILSWNHGVPVVVAGLFILLLCVPILRTVIVRRERLILDTTFCLMLVYLGVVLLSSLVAVTPAGSLEYAARFVIEGLLVYVLVVNAVRSLTTLRHVFWTMLAAGSLLGALTMYQEVTGAIHMEFGGLAARNHEYAALQSLDREDPEARELLESFLNANGTSGRSQRANGPLDEANRYGQIMVTLLPLAVAAYRFAKHPWVRAAAVAGGLLVASAVVYTDSRGAFVTVLLLAAIAGGWRWISRPRLMLAALAGILLVPVVAPEYVSRVTSLLGVTVLVEDKQSPETDGAIKGRAAAMTAAARVFADHPLLGVGAGQFQPHYSAEYQLNDPRFRFRDVRPYHAHSLYLQLAAELGALGLTAFLAIFAFQLRELERARRRWMTEAPWQTDVTVALSLSILGYLGTSLFLHFGAQRYLWMFVALASAALHVLRAAERERRGTLAVAR